MNIFSRKPSAQEIAYQKHWAEQEQISTDFQEARKALPAKYRIKQQPDGKYAVLQNYLKSPYKHKLGDPFIEEWTTVDRLGVLDDFDTAYETLNRYLFPDTVTFNALLEEIDEEGNPV